MTGILWRLRRPKSISTAFTTRNTRYIASALERLRAAGLVKEVRKALIEDKTLKMF